nr:TonB-dependent receptor [Paludibacteraceae bacterium]
DKFRLMPDASGGNIESLLVTFAGVSSTNELSSQYSVRGGNYDENSVYVNGIEVYRPLLVRSGQQEGLSFINPDMVNSVEFSAGGFDSKFGDKMSSVLNITYKKPKKFEAATSVSLLGASAYVGSAGKKFTQMHGMRYKTSAYLLGSLDTKGEYSPWFIDYQTYLTYRFNPKWEITFLGNISQNTYRFIPKERETSFGTLQMSRNFKVYFDGMENDIFRTFFGAFTTNYKPSKNVDLSFMLSAFNTNEQETYDITGQYWLADLDLSSADKTDKAKTTLGVGTYHEHARNRLSATVANFSHMGEFRYQNNTLQWGVGAQEEIIFDRIQEWEFRDSAGYSMPYNPNRVELIYNLTSHIDMYSTRLTAYVQDVYKLRREHGLWSFTGGLRANWWSYNKEFLISPRGTVTYFPKWKQDFNFRFAAGLYYQTPFYKEILRPVTDINGS